MRPLDWNAALTVLKESVPQTQFQNWLKPVEFIRRKEHAVVLGVPSRFHEEWIRSHYTQALTHVIRDQVGQSLQLEFELLEKETPWEQAQGSIPTPVLTPPARPVLRVVESGLTGASLRPVHEEDLSDSPEAPLAESPQLPSFPNPFVEMEYNQVAFRCTRLFAEGGEVQFNPLIVFAGVGMGKTHLLTEIGRQMHARRPGARVRYVSAEGFAGEFFQALRSPSPNTIIAFKKKYREHTDCLLFDDLEVLSGKTKTQEELLHIFNEIHARGGKVAFGTSVPPHRLEKLIEPLKSRLLSGVIAEVKYPSFGERVSLLERMCAHYGMSVPVEVLRTLADQGQKDVRELIGTLVRLHLQAKIENRPLDHQYLNREGVTSEPRREGISLEEIVCLVEHNYGICRTELQSKSRKGTTNWARQVAMYLARHHTLLPLEQIGHAFGRDHATVIHAFQKVAETMESQPTRRFEVEFLRQKLQGRSSRPTGHGREVSHDNSL